VGADFFGQLLRAGKIVGAFLYGFDFGRFCLGKVDRRRHEQTPATNPGFYESSTKAGIVKSRVNANGP